MSKTPESETIFAKMSWLFRGKRFKDSSFSWVVCVCSAVCNAVNLGFALSFGVLFPELMEYFDETRERTALVGSAALGMLWFASPLAGYLCDRFGCRITTFLGGLLCMTGLASTSFVKSLTLMYLTHSLVLGLGACFIYNSCYLVIGQYFKEKLSIATGVVALGASLGVLYTGPLLQVLLDSFQWRGALRMMIAFYGVVCYLSLAFNPNVEDITSVETINSHADGDGKKGISLYCSVWTFPTFTVVVVSLMFGSFGMYIPYINLVTFSEDLGISAQKASLLFIFIGLASSVARLISGRLCHYKKVNPVFIYQSSMLLAGLSAFVLPFAAKYWHLVAFSVTYGLSDGIFITTQCFILLSCVDSKRTTASFCINNVLYALTATAGGPIAGMIADKTGNYVYSFYMTGAVLIVAFLIPMMLIVINRRKSTVHPQNVEEVENEKSVHGDSNAGLAL